MIEKALTATPPSAFGSRDRGVVPALCQTIPEHKWVKTVTWTADSEIIESNHLCSRLDDKLGVDGLRSRPTALVFDFEDNTRHRSR
jgi:hypothetical protein